MKKHTQNKNNDKNSPIGRIPSWLLHQEKPRMSLDEALKMCAGRKEIASGMTRRETKTTDI